MQTSATNRRIRVLVRQLEDGTLIPRPDFQRRLVWSNRHKCAFIETVLNGLPFPEIYIAAGEVNVDTGVGTEMLVDGQQRLTTLLQYFKGASELRLADRIPVYSDLSNEAKSEFLEYEVVVRDLGHVDIETIKEIFQRINSTSYSLNAMETRNARYDGELKRFGEQLARNVFFQKHRVFGTTEIRRMHDVRFALVLTITILSAYFNRDDEVETYLERYNEKFEHRNQVLHQLQHVFTIVDNCEFERGSRVWKKADLFTVLVECHRALFKDQKTFDWDQLAVELKRFYEAVDKSDAGGAVREEVETYRHYAVQATNDRSSRIKRGKIIERIIDECTKEALFVWNRVVREEDDKMYWEEAAEQAIKNALEAAEWHDEPPSVELYVDDSGYRKSCFTIDELRAMLMEIADSEAYANMPFEAGRAMFEYDALEDVNNVIEEYRDEIEGIGWEL